MRTGRQAGLIAWRSQSPSARAPRVRRARSNWRRFQRLRPACSRRCSSGITVTGAPSQCSARRRPPWARPSSASPAAPAPAASARARPPSRRSGGDAVGVGPGQGRRLAANCRRPAWATSKWPIGGSSGQAIGTTRSTKTPPRCRAASSSCEPGRDRARRSRSAARRRPAARRRGGPTRRPRAALLRARRRAPRAAVPAGALGKRDAMPVTRRLRARPRSPAGAAAAGLPLPRPAPRRRCRRCWSRRRIRAGAPRSKAASPATRARRRRCSGSWRTRVDMGERAEATFILGVPPNENLGNQGLTALCCSGFAVLLLTLRESRLSCSTGRGWRRARAAGR